MFLIFSAFIACSGGVVEHTPIETPSAQEVAPVAEEAVSTTVTTESETTAVAPVSVTPDTETNTTTTTTQQ